MRLEQPSWWTGSRPADRLKAALLAPAGWVYGAAANARFALASPYRSSLPVICIGNFTAGGAGKTPLAIAIARMARDWGGRPAFLTRGYGGSIEGPHRVDASVDGAAEVGDEALLLARAAPTYLARDRADGARAIEATGADLIIMDDGFQNPSLHKDLAIVAVDAGAGLGNGRVLPAGPLRAPLGDQLKRAGVIVSIGREPCDLTGRSGAVPLLRGHIKPSGDTGWLKSSPILAFCGIGRPSKFFATLTSLGAEIAETVPFPDHHAFTGPEAADLLAKAARAGATLVTTEKDWVRIDTRDLALSELKAKTRTLPIAIEFEAASQPILTHLLLKAMDRDAAPAPAPR
ncbi:MULTISPECIES: tetraacyldisaccharide 4'-kinase [Rhodomicrobium]|uniref:tetraacyldisaccharide 4'-kinase n=1 Tax=Rhodomicrobium TaxID=1068 RepID=UPI000B4C0165|nr:MULTISPECIES: tetraacyldisaccharide 4'-kinase [Rhodomicrobium]